MSDPKSREIEFQKRKEQEKKIYSNLLSHAIILSNVLILLNKLALDNIFRKEQEKKINARLLKIKRKLAERWLKFIEKENNRDDKELEKVRKKIEEDLKKMLQKVVAEEKEEELEEKLVGYLSVSDRQSLRELDTYLQRTDLTPEEQKVAMQKYVGLIFQAMETFNKAVIKFDQKIQNTLSELTSTLLALKDKAAEGISAEPGKAISTYKALKEMMKPSKVKKPGSAAEEEKQPTEKPKQPKL